MHKEPSRREKREAKFYYLAEQGKFKAEPRLYLYKSEEKALKKDGFNVSRIGDNKKEALPSEVSWEEAFKNGVTPFVRSYIIGAVKTFPKNLNWAQELFVIAARANYVKDKSWPKTLE